jgi:hypothetical protein
MLRHLGGVGVFILAVLDSSVLPSLGAVTRSRYSYPLGTQGYGPIHGRNYFRFARQNEALASLRYSRM